MNPEESLARVRELSENAINRSAKLPPRPRPPLMPITMQVREAARRDAERLRINLIGTAHDPEADSRAIVRAIKALEAQRR